jgi:hypothetical protein
MKTKPLIEKYLTYLRTSEERALARIKGDPRLTPGNYDLNMAFFRAYGITYKRMTEQAQKYQLAASAQAMINAIRPRPLLQEWETSIAVLTDIADHKRELDPDIDTPILHLPSSPIWLELEEPIPTNTGEIVGMYFTSADRAVEQLLKEPQTPGMAEALQKAGRKPDQSYRWTLNFINADGTPTSHYEYHEDPRAWSIIPNAEPCPTDECIIDEEVNDYTGERHTYVIPCDFCATILAYWRSWFVTALLVIQGEFAATEDRVWPTRREETTRKVKRAHSNKYDEIPIRHDYYLVSFDASVKKRTPAKPEESDQEREKTQRGSWVAAAQEIDPESIVFVRHDFGRSQRRLDPEHNSRWKQKQTIDVKAHARSVPMKVNSLQKRIVRVIASKYEESTQEGENK